jgi:hypothetical protein
MPAGLQCRGKIVWGTNGMIEACLDAFEKIACERYGISDEIVSWCRSQRTAFFPGAVVEMDSLVQTDDARRRILSVVLKSFATLKKDFSLTDVGKAWVDLELPKVLTLVEGKKADPTLKVV